MFFFFFFSIWVFLSRTFMIHKTAGERGGYLFNSSLPLPPASQTLRHQLGDYCRELTSAHSWQPDSNQEPLVSEGKSLTTKLRAHCGEMLSYAGGTFFRIVSFLIQFAIPCNVLSVLASSDNQPTYFLRCSMRLVVRPWLLEWQEQDNSTYFRNVERTIGRIVLSNIFQNNQQHCCQSTAGMLQVSKVVMPTSQQALTLCCVSLCQKCKQFVLWRGEFIFMLRIKSRCCI